MNFVNLHNHTDRGSFDSIMTAERFISRLKELNQQYLVQTDHGTMRGMVGLAQEAAKNDIKFIPGMEAYVTFDRPTKQKDEFGRLYYHMLLLAKNKRGLHNLQSLVKMSYDPEHMYYKPRISLDEIFKHSNGLIATSGCLASLTSQTILAEAQGVENLSCSQCHILGHPCDDHVVPENIVLDPSQRGARSINSLLDRFLQHFGEDFYLELQDSGAGQAQDLVNSALIDIGKEKGIPLIVTSDAHYAQPDEAELRSMVLRIRHGKTAEEAADEKFYEEGRIYLKSGEELAAIFGDEPVENTVQLAKKCKAEIDFETTYFPIPNLPEKVTDEEHLRRLCTEALFSFFNDKNISNEQKPEYLERLEMEISTIVELKFPAYFLVLKEILDWCKDNGILVGPGRGSAAGSLVSYMLGITNVDPIQYGLFFSRFLNKARVSWPDIDIDIPKNRREEVIEYIVEKYGNDKVCQIMTFSSMKPKGMARDLGRTMSLQKLGEEIAELIPPPLHGKDPTVSESIEQVPELENKKYEPIVSRMKVLEGLNRTTGVHAAGVVISSKPLDKICPVEFQGKKKDKPVAQLTMDELESIGLIKMDFLGLRTLDCINNTIKIVDALESVHDIPDDDPDTYEYLRTTGEFGAIFQFEGSPAIGALLHDIQPKNLEDIAAATALFRPGPLGVGMDKLYIRNRTTGDVGDIHPLLKTITEDTYGCLIYQESLMKMCVSLAGFSEEDADRVRKVLGKKKREQVEEWRKPFIEGCTKTSNLSDNQANDLFENIQTGADYLFNKSHAVAYSLISYWCAYLRCHHTSAYMSSVLNASFDNKDKLLSALKTCKNLGIKVVPPQIENLKELCSPLDENTVQVGLAVCSYLKKGSKDAIVASEYNPKTLYQYFALVNRSKFNSGKAIALAKAGVLDGYGKEIGLNRTGIIKCIPDLYEYFKLVGKKAEQRVKWEDRKARREQQDFLKAQGKDYGGRLVGIGKEPELPEPFDFTPYQTIQEDLFQQSMDEHEILGFALKYFPTDFMDKSHDAMTIEEAYHYGESNLAAIGGFSWKRQVKVKLAGLVSQFKEHLTRKKKPRAAFTLEDHTGIADCNIFTNNYAEMRGKLDDRTCIECDCVILKAQDDVLEVSVNSYRILSVLPDFTSQLKTTNRDDSGYLVAESYIHFEELINEYQTEKVRFGNLYYKGTK